MWKKIKAFIPWIISIISTVFITKFFTRRNSSGNEHSRAAEQIENELTRNRELSKQSNGKINSISEEFRRNEARIESIAEGLSNIESGLSESSNDSKRIGELNSENIDIIQELQNRYNKGYKESTNTKWYPNIYCNSPYNVFNY